MFRLAPPQHFENFFAGVVWMGMNTGQPEILFLPGREFQKAGDYVKLILMFGDGWSAGGISTGAKSATKHPWNLSDPLM